MKAHWFNAMFGFLDYLAYPVGMLLLAPVILHALGVERYGVWMMTCAIVNTGSILASGFGDANTRAIAINIGSNGRTQLLTTIRSTLAIHLVLGAVVAGIEWLAAPAFMRSAVTASGGAGLDCLWALRIAAMLMLVRAVETVCVSTQRAFGRYGPAIQLSVAARILALTAAAIVPYHSRSVSAVMISALIIHSLAVYLQVIQIKRLLGADRLLPSFDRESTRALLGFGTFTWIQSVAGLLFGQVDRIIAGVMFGAAAVTPYAFCAQLAQPVYGLAAAGLHFLFPHVASHSSDKSTSGMRRSIAGAFAANLVFAVIALAVLLLYGERILRLWAGPAISAASAPLIPAIAWSATLSALGVTGCYSLLALGKPHLVTALNITGGLAMIVAIPFLASRYGLAGIAYGRLLFGPVVLLVYLPLFSMLKRQSLQPEIPVEYSICEEL